MGCVNLGLVYKGYQKVNKKVIYSEVGQKHMADEGNGVGDYGIRARFLKCAAPLGLDNGNMGVHFSQNVALNPRTLGFHDGAEIYGGIAYIARKVADKPQCYLGIASGNYMVVFAKVVASQMDAFDDSYVIAPRRCSKGDAFAWLAEHLDERTIDVLLTTASGRRPKRMSTEPLVHPNNGNGATIRWRRIGRES